MLHFPSVCILSNPVSLKFRNTFSFSPPIMSIKFYLLPSINDLSYPSSTSRMALTDSKSSNAFRYLFQSCNIPFSLILQSIDNLFTFLRSIQQCKNLPSSCPECFTSRPAIFYLPPVQHAGICFISSSSLWYLLTFFPPRTVKSCSRLRIRSEIDQIRIQPLVTNWSISYSSLLFANIYIWISDPDPQPWSCFSYSRLTMLDSPFLQSIL